MEIFFAHDRAEEGHGVDDPTVKPRAGREASACSAAGSWARGIAYVTVNAGVPVRVREQDDAAAAQGARRACAGSSTSA